MAAPATGVLRVGPPDETFVQCQFSERSTVYLDLRLLSVVADRPANERYRQGAVQLNLFEDSDEVRYRSNLSQLLETIGETLRASISRGGTIVVHTDVFGAVARASISWILSGRPLYIRTSGERLDGRGRRLNEGLLVYGAKSGSALVDSTRQLLEGRSRSAHERVEAGSNRKFVLGDCVGRASENPNLSYEWNGHFRTWRWSLEKMQQLLREGRLEHTRSGLPRIKHYLDTVKSSSRRSVVKFARPTRDILGALFRDLVCDDAASCDLVGVECSDATFVLAAHGILKSWLASTPSHRYGALIRNEIIHRAGYRVPYVFAQRESVASAVALATNDPEEFRYWVLESTGAIFSERIRSKNLLVDGYIVDEVSTPIPLLITLSRLDQRVVDRLVRQVAAARMRNAVSGGPAGQAQESGTFGKPVHHPLSILLDGPSDCAV